MRAYFPRPRDMPDSCTVDNEVMAAEDQDWIDDQAKRVELTAEALKWIDSEVRGRREAYVYRWDWTLKFEPFLGPLFTFLSTYPKRYTVSGDFRKYRVTPALRQAVPARRGTPDVPAGSRKHPIGGGYPEPCKFWPYGKCRFGEKCKFAHDEEYQVATYQPIGAERAHPYR